MSGGSTSSATTSSGPPANVLSAYNSLLQRAQSVADTPLNQYDVGPNASNVVAGFNPTQENAFGLIGANTDTAQPYIQQAAGEFGNATTPLWSGLPQFNAQNVGQYLNPATQDVLDTTQKQFGILNQEQQNSLVGNAISQKAFGGDRAAVAQGVLGGQQAAQEAPVLAGIEQGNYNQALQEFNQQQGAQLGANEANAWLASQAGFGLANLGGEAQNLNLSGANALLGVGNMQQQLAQEQLNVPYEQFLQRQAYPFQTTNFLAGIDTGVGSSMGGQSTTTQNTPGPDTGSQVAGGLMTAAAIAAMFMNRGGGIAPRLKRAPGGGIYADPAFALVPDLGKSYVGAPLPPVSHGSGPPSAPGVAPGPQADPMGDANALAGIASMFARQPQGLGGFMGSGVSDADMANLSGEANALMGAGIGGPGVPAFRRGGAPRGYDEGGDIDDMDMVIPDVGRGIVPLRYVQNSPYQRPDWQPGADDPRMTDPGNYAGYSTIPEPPAVAGNDAPAPRASAGIAGNAPSVGRAPSSAASDNGEVAPWKLGLLAAGLGILGGRSQNGFVNFGRGALEGLKTYEGVTAQREQEADRRAQQADTASYRKANLDLEAKKLSDAADEARQRIKLEGDRNDRAAQAEQDTAAYRTGELANQSARTDIERQRLKAEQGKGFWEPTAPVLGDDGKPKTDPATGAPLYTWQDRTTMKTQVAPYSPETGLGRGAAGKGQSASQWKYDAWLAAHPDDTQGALDFVAGHKQMGDADIAKTAHAMAAADYRNFFGSGVTPPPKDADAWMAQRRQDYETQLRGSRGQPQVPAVAAPAGNDPLGIR